MSIYLVKQNTVFYNFFIHTVVYKPQKYFYFNKFMKNKSLLTKITNKVNFKTQ